MLSTFDFERMRFYGALVLLISSLTHLCVSSIEWPPQGVQYEMTRELLVEKYGCTLCGEHLYGDVTGGYQELCYCADGEFFLGAIDSLRSPNKFIVGAFYSRNSRICQGGIRGVLMNGVYWNAGDYIYPGDKRIILEFFAYPNSKTPALRWVPWTRSDVYPYPPIPPGQGYPIVYGERDNELLIQAVYRCPLVLTTSSPAALPSPMPTTLPSPMPTTLPSPMPTTLPSPMPTTLPSPMPTPTPLPSPMSTLHPNLSPAPQPRPRPTRSPTPRKTPRPTRSPTPKRTPRPTRSPTPKKTPRPTRSPTPKKTPRPSRKRTRYPSRNNRLHARDIPTTYA
jgi:hypothetical protein